MRETLFQLYDQLQKKGLKLTPARKIMLEILLQSGERLTNASELYDQVRLRSQRINFSTVYRNLEILVDCGLIQKITFEGSAKYNLLEAGTHRHHLICTSCNKTEPLPYCPISELEAAVKKDTDFLPTDHKVEIYGFCKDCRHKKGC